MLIKDEAALARHERGDAHASYADRVNAATYDDLGRARLMEDGDLAPNNPARQMGRVLTPRQFETDVVAKLGVPNLLTEVHPTNKNKRCMFQIRGGEKHLICVYENNPMPEFSIIMGVSKWVPDPGYLGDGGKVAQRGDLEGDAKPVTNAEAFLLVQKHGLTGAVAELDKRLEGEPSRLGMKKIVVPGAEKVRGWRTVLVYMMQHGLCSPEQVRNVVADADRASWAGHTGARPEALGEWLR